MINSGERSLSEVRPKTEISDIPPCACASYEVEFLPWFKFLSPLPSQIIH